MNGYRVCLDCDERIAVDGDDWHKIDDGVFIGCEGYWHTETEGAIRNTEVDKVVETAIDVIHGFTRDCLLTGHLYSEDYADAFYSVGQLFMEISAQMLNEVYKDDNDQTVVQHMKMVLEQATADGDEARATLVPFLPSIDQI